MQQQQQGLHVPVQRVGRQLFKEVSVLATVVPKLRFANQAAGREFETFVMHSDACAIHPFTLSHLLERMLQPPLPLGMCILGKV